MKRFVLGLLVAISVMFVLGCVSGEAAKEPEYKPPIGLDGNPIPEWAFNPGEDADKVYFTGTAESVTHSESEIRFEARKDAFNQMATWLGGRVEGLQKNFNELSGATFDKQMLKNLGDTLINYISADNSNFTPGPVWISSDKSYGYVLCSYPKNSIVDAFKTTMNDFVRNEAAAFAEFKAQNAYDEVVNYFVNYFQNNLSR